MSHISPGAFDDLRIAVHADNSSAVEMPADEERPGAMPASDLDAFGPGGQTESRKHSRGLGFSLEVYPEPIIDQQLLNQTGPVSPEAIV
jgi:hypothetical protein